MGFWEEITGYTADGLSVKGMPEGVVFVYSIKNHIEQLLNTRKGSSFLNPDMGISDIPDVLTKVPSWSDEFAVSIKNMVLEFDKRIKDIKLYDWVIDKKETCLKCKMVVVTQRDQIIRYCAVFSGIGNNHLLIAGGEDE